MNAVVAIAKPLRSLPFAAKMGVVGALLLIPIVMLIVVLFVQINADLPIGSLLTIRLNLPNAQPIDASGRVVATGIDPANSRHVHNVKFSDISDSARDSVLSYILEARRKVLVASS